MPIYEYQCTSCEERFEMRRSISDDDGDVRCPKCGAERPRRIISAFLSGASTQSTCAPSGSG